MSHTYVVLDISLSAYREIADALRAAEYHHAFHDDGDGVVIDMHGIALRATPPPTPPTAQPATSQPRTIGDVRRDLIDARTAVQGGDLSRVADFDRLRAEWAQAIHDYKD